MHSAYTVSNADGQGRSAVPEPVLADMRWANAKPDDGKTPIMSAWFWRCDDGENAIAVGRCPICYRLHAHGISRNPIRNPHCSVGTPRFPTVADKPDAIRLRYAVGELPDDIAYELRVERPDLLALAAIAKGGSKWSRERTRIAIRAIRRVGVLDERVALLIVGSGLSAKAATRLSIAHFVRRQPGRTTRARLGNALVRAYVAAGRGEFVA